jgi:hypothetical protein
VRLLLIRRRPVDISVNDQTHVHQERLAAHHLYGGRRTIDVAPLEAPASSYDSRRAAHQKSSNGGRP